MPGIGFLLGGLIATIYSPRATFAFAGIGVLAVVALAVPLLGAKWSIYAATRAEGSAEDDVMVELIPAMPMRMPVEGHRDSKLEVDK